jgi:hypothetical protein
VERWTTDGTGVKANSFLTPFPAPDDAILRCIIDEALVSHTAGTLDLAGAITRAAIHAWFEGRIQGEGACPGCEFRGLVTETGDQCGRCTPARYRELRRDRLMPRCAHYGRAEWMFVSRF